MEVIKASKLICIITLLGASSSEILHMCGPHQLMPPCVEQHLLVIIHEKHSEWPKLLSLSLSIFSQDSLLISFNRQLWIIVKIANFHLRNRTLIPRYLSKPRVRPRCKIEMNVLMHFLYDVLHKNKWWCRWSRRSAFASIIQCATCAFKMQPGILDA